MLQDIVVIFVNYVRKHFCFYLENILFHFYVEYQTVKMNFNLTYTPDYQNTSSNASQQLQLLINQTLNTALINVTTGGFRPDLISIV